MDDDFGDDEDFGLGGEELQEDVPGPQQLGGGTSIAAAVEAAQPAAVKQPAQQDDFAADELYGDIHDGLANADSGTAATAALQPVQLAHQQQQQQPAKPQQPQATLQQPSRPPPPVALPMQRDGSNGATTSSVVFIGNLQWWTTDAELEAACAEFGPVSAVQFTEDKASGRSKGYARVHFSDATAAEQCKAGLSGREINGKACIVTLSSTASAPTSASPAVVPPASFADRAPRPPPPFMGGRGGMPPSGFPGGRGPADAGGMFRPGMPGGMGQGPPGRGMMAAPGMMGMGMPGHGMMAGPPGGGAGGGMVAAGRGGGMMGGSMMAPGMNGGMGGLGGGMRPFMGGAPGRGGMGMGMGPSSGMGPGGMGLPSPFTSLGGGLSAGMPGFDTQPDSKRRRL